MEGRIPKGMMKRLMELQQVRRDTATDVAVRADVLKRCEFCEDVYDPLNFDPSPAYMLANHLFSTDHRISELFDGNRKMMTDEIQQAILETPEDCYCAHHAAMD